MTAPGPDPRVVDHLRCPVCAAGLTSAAIGTGTALRCPRGHSFDIARQGYVNLLTGRAPHGGDTAEMIAARAEFLAAGHYDTISTALAEAAAQHLTPGCAAATDATETEPRRCAEVGRAPGAPAAADSHPLVVETGAGTARHLGAVLAAVPTAVGLALDIAKPAVRRAARAHPRLTAALADTWQRLPLADASVAILLNVFAPRNGPEFHRVLDPAGRLLVVTPTAEHLTELVDALGLLRVDPTKADRVAASLSGHFTEESSTAYRQELSLSSAEVATLVGMGPSAWHTDPAGLADRIAALGEPVRVTMAVRLGVHRPRR